MFFDTSPRFKATKESSPGPGVYDVESGTFLPKRKQLYRGTSAPTFGRPQTSPTSPLDERSSFLTGEVTKTGQCVAKLVHKPAPGSYHIRSTISTKGAMISPPGKTKAADPVPGPGTYNIKTTISPKRTFRKPIDVSPGRVTRSDWLASHVESDVCVANLKIPERVGPGAYTPSLDGTFLRKSFNRRLGSPSPGSSPRSPGRSSPSSARRRTSPAK